MTHTIKGATHPYFIRDSSMEAGDAGDPWNAWQVASDIYEAGEGKWMRTDEDTFQKLLAGRTGDEITQLNRAYIARFGHGLEKSARLEMSGEALEATLRLIRGEFALEAHYEETQAFAQNAPAEMQILAKKINNGKKKFEPSKNEAGFWDSASSLWIEGFRDISSLRNLQAAGKAYVCSLYNKAAQEYNRGDYATARATYTRALKFEKGAGDAEVRLLENAVLPSNTTVAATAAATVVAAATAPVWVPVVATGLLSAGGAILGAGEAAGATIGSATLVKGGIASAGVALLVTPGCNTRIEMDPPNFGFTPNLFGIGKPADPPLTLADIEQRYPKILEDLNNLSFLTEAELEDLDTVFWTQCPAVIEPPVPVDPNPPPDSPNPIEGPPMDPVNPLDPDPNDPGFASPDPIDVADLPMDDGTSTQDNNPPADNNDPLPDPNDASDPRAPGPVDVGNSDRPGDGGNNANPSPDPQNPGPINLTIAKIISNVSAQTLNPDLPDPVDAENLQNDESVHANEDLTTECTENRRLVKGGFFTDMTRVSFHSLTTDPGIVNYQDPVAQLIYDMLGPQSFTSWSRVESGQMDTHDHRLAASLLRAFALMGHVEQIYQGASNSALRNIFALDLGEADVREANLELARQVDRQLRLFKNATDAQSGNNGPLTLFRNHASDIMEAVEKKDLATATHIFLSMEEEINGIEAAGGAEGLDPRYVNILLGSRDMIHSYLTILWKNGFVDQLPKNAPY